MSLLENTSANFNSSSSKRSYITTAPFNTSIYSYTTRFNPSPFRNEGKLALVEALPSGVVLSSTNCPAGRILRETGRKLYPGANPGLVSGDTYNGTVVATNTLNHMWVGVFDSVTGLRGFIDPNSPGFAVYNSDRNAAFVDLGEQTGGTPTRLGYSVYTGGNVTASGSMTAGSSVSAATSVSAGTSMSASTTMTAQKYLTSPVGSGTGSVGTPLTASAGYTTFNGGTPASQRVYTTQVTATSLVFITVNNVSARAVSAVPGSGYFDAYSSVNGDTSTFYWLVLN